MFHDFWVDESSNAAGTELTFGSESQNQRFSITPEGVGRTTYQNILRILGPSMHEDYTRRGADDVEEKQLWILPQNADPMGQAGRFLSAARVLGSEPGDVYIGSFPDKEKIILTKNPAAIEVEKKKAFFGEWSYNLIHMNMGRALYTLCNQRVSTPYPATRALLIKESQWYKEALVHIWTQDNGKKTVVAMSGVHTVILTVDETEPGFSFRKEHPVVASNRSEAGSNLFTPGMTKYGLATYMHLGYRLMVMIANDEDGEVVYNSIKKGYQHEMAQKLGLNRNDFGRSN